MRGEGVADLRAAALVPDDMPDRFICIGTLTQVGRQAQATFEAGATRVDFGTPQGLTDAGGGRLLRKRGRPQPRG